MMVMKQMKAIAIFSIRNIAAFFRLCCTLLRDRRCFGGAITAIAELN